MGGQVYRPEQPVHPCRQKDATRQERKGASGAATRRTLPHSPLAGAFPARDRGLSNCLPWLLPARGHIHILLTTIFCSVLRSDCWELDVGDALYTGSPS